MIPNFDGLFDALAFLASMLIGICAGVCLFLLSNDRVWLLAGLASGFALFACIKWVYLK